MDELPAHAGDECNMYDTNVGYVSCEYNFRALRPTVTILKAADWSLLAAELPPATSIRELIRQAEGTDAFSQFHLYVCSALLVKFSERLREMDFQVRLRSHPTRVLLLLISTGNHHLPATATNTPMEGSRCRAAPFRGVRPQDGMARGRKPFCKSSHSIATFRDVGSIALAVDQAV